MLCFYKNLRKCDKTFKYEERPNYYIFNNQDGAIGKKLDFIIQEKNEIISIGEKIVIMLV